jgi:mRNA-degrading endonuclease toxin of MazEF toxin-antitoxin module
MRPLCAKPPTSPWLNCKTMEVQCGGIYLYDPPTSSTSDQGASLVQSGSEQSGLRPYIIVSRDSVNRNKPTALGVPLSTRVHKANSYRIMLPASELIKEVTSHYQFQNSVALCDHIRVIDLSRLRSKIGKVSVNALAAVGLGLAFVFDIQ